MTSLASSLMGGLIGPSVGGLPPLPGNLGLPEKSNAAGTVTRGGRDDHTPFVGNSQRSKYEQEYAKAETYNKAFADLLNNQPQLNGSERKQIYDAYSDKFTQQKATNGKDLTNYGASLSQLTPDQYQAQLAAQQQQQAAPAPTPQPAPQQQVAAPALPTPQPQAPQTVGPAPKPQEPAPPPTPTVATEGGNIAGKTTTNNEDVSGKSRGRRGRVATLLTGLGGAVERFGL